ncbi:carotenoid oxygenase family protein [Pendulispora rubella]|uniref:Carotenoid oxygenase family protein n=1 Tax=Pendulispora rubella TaxID=2741070 RepID=A0ABZ2L7T3_9BACT
MIRRREFLSLSALMGGHLVLGRTLGGCNDSSNGAGAPLFLGGLTTNLAEEQRYAATLTGTVPRDLRGTLYRNGPGIFQRGGARIATLLDGDGMVIAWRFTDAGIEFQNRFVQTPRFTEETAAGTFLYDTWTTKRPGGGPPNAAEQAGVTVYNWQGKVYAFGESSPPWELAPNDLATLGQRTFGYSLAESSVCAHTKQLAESREWAMFGQSFATSKLQMLVLDSSGSVVERWSLPTTDFGPPTYIHDFFCTPTHLVVHLMPIVADGSVLGQGGVFRDTLKWTAGKAGRLVVFRRRDSAPPKFIELEGAWMWHSANAYERPRNELVLDWIGYDDPWHFLGDDAYFKIIMNGETRRTGAPGAFRRTVIDLVAGTQRTERHATLPWQEFPMVAPSRVGRSYRYAYHLFTPESGILWRAVAKLDVETGRTDVFDFGPGRWALEPTFAPRPNGTAEDDGWLLVETVNERGPAALEIFDARRVADGPVATATIRTHIPMHFHGHWAPRTAGSPSIGGWPRG